MQFNRASSEQFKRPFADPSSLTVYALLGLLPPYVTSAEFDTQRCTKVTVAFGTLGSAC
jgi:hypothetical protein